MKHKAKKTAAMRLALEKHVEDQAVAAALRVWITKLLKDSLTTAI